ncbi:hypothetical protein CSQ88_06430 [Iodobacter sp. BJB302]|nr:hypothetical protein CSQ88_06430 [Iodobacter sp. BJB302]
MRSSLRENGMQQLSGWKKLKEVDDQAGERVVNSLRDIAPDLGRYIIEFAFGEIYSRPGLTLAQRELATVAMLSAMGNAAPQLKVHLEAALNVGLSREEIIEVLIQTAVYAGFPAALNAVFAAKEIFAQYHAPSRPLAPLAVAKAFVASFIAGQPPLDYLSEAITWHIPGDRQIVPWAGHWEGRAEVEQCLKQIAAAGQATQFVIDRWYDGENEALARGHFAWQYKNGHAYQGAFVMRFVVLDGEIQSYEMFEDSFAIAKGWQA